MKRSILQEALRRISLAYHQRGIEKTQTEISKTLALVREQEGCDLAEAIAIVEEDALNQNRKED